MAENYPLNLRAFLTFRLTRLQAQINSQAQHILRAHCDVGQTEWRVMFMVADLGEGTMAQVVRDGKIDKAQVSRAVKSLVKSGYLNSRVDAADHRQSILSLTDEGRAVYARVLPLMQERQRHLMSTLADDEIDKLYEVLDRLEEAAQRRDF